LGYSEARRRILAALLDGAFSHEARESVEVKNLLLTGEVTAAFVAALVGRSSGADHTMSPHHALRTVTVHVIRRESWYVKFYFIDDDSVFISVHR
jgi:hypothetical protein